MSKEKITKTRATLVEAARKLFADRGKGNVTMNEIAIAASKGRRTIYTYFSNKDEIYLAVIENELDLLIERLKTVLASNLSPERKLEEYIFVRFEAIKEAISRNGSLRAEFFQNFYEVDKARRPIDVREIRLIKQIFDEGVAAGTFRLNNTQWVAMMFLYSLKGLEIPYINNNIGNYIKGHKTQIMSVILSGIRRQQPQELNQ